jgi:AMMECR1 domain-containing protein
MMADCWYEEDAKIYKFEGRIFSEVEPKGEVIERSLKACK